MRDPLFSRPVSPCPLGKCTDEIKTVVPEQVKEQLTALAILRGQTVSEYLRDLLVAHIFGHVYAIRVRLNGPEEQVQEKGRY